MVEGIAYRTQSVGAYDVLLPTTGPRHAVAKDHKPSEKNVRVDLREQKAHTYGHTLIYTHTHIHVSKVSFFYPFYFGQLWTH